MRSWCFDSIATEVDGVTTYDREYGSAEFREVMRLLVGDGVYVKNSTNMQVIPNGDLSVSVLPGYCWVHGAMGAVDEAESLTLETSTNGRTDLIVARFDTSLAYRSIRLAVVQGTEGATTVPELTRNDTTYDICIARVRVRGGATSVLTADITDTRLNANVCGIVTGVIDQIDATTLFDQYEAVFNDFMEELESALTGDVAGNLLVLINENEAKIDTHIADVENPHGVTKTQLGIGTDMIPEEDLYGHDTASLVGTTGGAAFKKICNDQNALPAAYIVTARIANSQGVLENNTGTAILFKDGDDVAIIVDGLTVNARYNDWGTAYGGYGFRAWCADSYSHDVVQVYVSAIGV